MSVVAPVPSGKDKTRCNGMALAVLQGLHWIDMKLVLSLQWLLLRLMQLTTRHMLA